MADRDAGPHETELIASFGGEQENRLRLIHLLESKTCHTITTQDHHDILRHTKFTDAWGEGAVAHMRTLRTEINEGDSLRLSAEADVFTLQNTVRANAQDMAAAEATLASLTETRGLLNSEEAKNSALRLEIEGMRRQHELEIERLNKERGLEKTGFEDSVAELDEEHRSELEGAKQAHEEKESELTNRLNTKHEAEITALKEEQRAAMTAFHLELSTELMQNIEDHRLKLVRKEEEHETEIEQAVEKTNAGARQELLEANTNSERLMEAARQANKAVIDELRKQRTKERTQHTAAIEKTRTDTVRECMGRPEAAHAAAIERLNTKHKAATQKAKEAKAKRILDIEIVCCRNIEGLKVDNRTALENLIKAHAEQINALTMAHTEKIETLKNEGQPQSDGSKLDKLVGDHRTQMAHMKKRLLKTNNTLISEVQTFLRSGVSNAQFTTAWGKVLGLKQVDAYQIARSLADHYKAADPKAPGTIAICGNRTTSEFITLVSIIGDMWEVTNSMGAFYNSMQDSKAALASVLQSMHRAQPSISEGGTGMVDLTADEPEPSEPAPKRARPNDAECHGGFGN